MSGARRTTGPAARTRGAIRHGRVLIGLLAAVGLLCAGSIVLYIDERDAQHKKYAVGNRQAADRIDLVVSVQQVDTVNDDLILSILPTPIGALVRPDKTPAKSFTLEIGTTASPPVLRFRAGQPIATQTVKVGFESGGTVSDYPFDHYAADLRFVSTVNGEHVPSLVTLREADPFFLVKVRGSSTYAQVVVYSIRVSRSRGTFIFAWFIMIAMWALALSVLGGTWILNRQHSGLVWPALGWMAATLFALVGMRNAAPGSPPIGSLIDYASFFWAEALVAVSLTFAVVNGLRADRAAMRAQR
jgi:Domain of unknown function (DUF4436)